MNGPGTHLWFSNPTLDDPYSLTPLVTPTTTTTYYLSAQLGDCQASDAVTVSIENCFSSVGTLADLNAICAGHNFTASTLGTSLLEGDAVGYILHAHADDNLLNQATHLAFNASGVFTNTNTGN